MSDKQAERRELWHQRITQQQRSGQSIRDFCREGGLAEHSFYSWRQRLRQQPPVTFALVETKGSEQASPIELVLASGDRLHIPREEAMLRMVLTVLRQPT